MRRRDQLPGLLPPFKTWTLPQLVVSLGIVVIAFLPWLFLLWVVWALSSAPIGDDLAVPQHAPGGKLSPPSERSEPEPWNPKGVE